MQKFDPTKKGPLEGLRIIDMSRLVAGNMLSLQLGDFGAEVIKVEGPPGGDPLRDWVTNGIESHWKVYGRNKKSIGLNLREDGAKDVLMRLIESADALIENFRPGTLEEIGLGPDVMLKRNPRLVIGRISGFGQTGPYREKPGFGTLVEAMSGFASRNGFPDRPPLLPPLALADMIAGLAGGTAMMVALYHRDLRGGKGQVMDLSLLEPIYSVMGPEAAIYQISGTIRERVGNGSNTASPRNVYVTSDGGFVAISASMEVMAQRLLRAIGVGHMLEDPRYATNAARVAHREEVDAVVGGWIGQRTLKDCLAFFEKEDITAAPIYNAAQIAEDPHFQERQVVVEVEDEELGSIPMHNVTPRLSGTPGGFRIPAPSIGQHNAELLKTLGFDGATVEDLTKRGVLWQRKQRKGK
ncbi:MAG: CoA transferase [Alphaproteobacteria bacterium]|nr:CoA transferase [Alphaproteobacteria bacterium]